MGRAGAARAFERDAAVVLRRVEEAARRRALEAGNRRAFLELLGRVPHRRTRRAAPGRRPADAALVLP